MKRVAAVVAAAAALGVVAGLLWPRARRQPSADAAAIDAPARGAPAPSSPNPAPSRPRPVAKVVDVEQGPVVHDPVAPGYDPTKLTHFGVTATEIFDREPRDRVWAPAMEQVMRDRMAHDLALVQPSARVGSVQCRTSSCEFVIEADEPLTESAQFALQILGNADVHAIAGAERSESGGETATYHALYAPEHRGLADNAAYYEHRRASILGQAKKTEDFDLVLPIDPEAR